MQRPFSPRARRAPAAGLPTLAATPASAAQPERIADTTATIGAGEVLELALGSAGGYSAVLTPQR